jgi:hypothetical protein
MAAQFCPLINQAAAAVPNLMMSMLWKTPDTITQLLGPRFLALVPTNRNPCLRYHIFGSCGSANCQFMHKLTPAPSLYIVTGIQAQVKARVEEFIAEAPGLHPCPSTTTPNNWNASSIAQEGT